MHEYHFSAGESGFLAASSAITCHSARYLFTTLCGCIKNRRLYDDACKMHFNALCRVTLMENRDLRSLKIAIGPELRDFGSWIWLGSDLVDFLADHLSSVTYRDDICDADVIVFIKFLPDAKILQDVARRSAVVYCPVDFYGSSAEIDADADRLQACHRIVVHSQRLARYFAGYSLVTYLDHHVKYVIPTRSEILSSGPILWVGVRSNLAPVVNWVNSMTTPLPAPLVVLTNLENPTHQADPLSLGFHSGKDIKVENWSRESHLRWLQNCRAAVDIKGDDFRARHKPPAKALDYLAAGIPLAMNADSSSVEHLRQLGFHVPSPDDQSTWFSPEYALESMRFGRTLSDLLSLDRVGSRWLWLLREVYVAVHNKQVT